MVVRREKPKGACWVGYAALVEDMKLAAPLAHAAAIVDSHGNREPRSFEGDPQVTLHEARQAPPPTAIGHLRFALQREPVNLLVLRKAIQQIPEQQIVASIRAAPTAVTSRRLWALAEFFLQRRLDVPAVKARSIEMVDSSRYHVVAGKRVSHHGVIDNLPGGPDFCPLVEKKPLAITLDESRSLAKSILMRSPSDLVRRALSWLALADSKSSFEIEGERPDARNLRDWAQAQDLARRQPLTIGLLENLQRKIFSEARFSEPPGLRSRLGREVFLGSHDWRTNAPLPEHIGAKASDVDMLMGGLMTYWSRTGTDSGYDPIVRASCLSFGFVNIHPFADGNGRLHRFLLDYAMREGGVADSMIVPLSMAVNDDRQGYIEVLRAMSGAAMDFVDWDASPRGNVIVRSDTADFFRYPSLDRCVDYVAQKTAECLGRRIPDEIEFLRRHDLAIELAQTALRASAVELSSATLSKAIVVARQNGGRIGAGKRKSLLAGVPDDAVDAIEAAVSEAFEIAVESDPDADLDEKNEGPEIH